MSDRYVVTRVELGGLIDAVWDDIGFGAPSRQRIDAILDVWLSIKPKAPTADIDGRLTRIEAMLTQSLSADSKSWFALGQDVREVKAMLQKITQAPSITRGPGPLDISVTTEDGRTASIKTVYPSADDLRRAWEKGVDPHTDDAETERALGKSYDPNSTSERLHRMEVGFSQLYDAMGAERHANSLLIAELRQRVEKLEEWKGVRDSWCEGGPWGG